MKADRYRNIMRVRVGGVDFQSPSGGENEVDREDEDIKGDTEKSRLRISVFFYFTQLTTGYTEFYLNKQVLSFTEMGRRLFSP
jgi:hypothetical protein